MSRTVYILTLSHLFNPDTHKLVPKRYKQGVSKMAEGQFNLLVLQLFNRPIWSQIFIILRISMCSSSAKSQHILE